VVVVAVQTPVVVVVLVGIGLQTTFPLQTTKHTR
jgi:hypothetical protein